MHKLASGPGGMVPEDRDDPWDSMPVNSERSRERFVIDAGFTRLVQMLDYSSGRQVAILSRRRQAGVPGAQPPAGTRSTVSREPVASA